MWMCAGIEYRWKAAIDNPNPCGCPCINFWLWVPAYQAPAINPPNKSLQRSVPCAWQVSAGGSPGPRGDDWLYQGGQVAKADLIHTAKRMWLVSGALPVWELSKKLKAMDSVCSFKYWLMPWEPIITPAQDPFCCGTVWGTWQHRFWHSIRSRFTHARLTLRTTANPHCDTGAGGVVNSSTIGSWVHPEPGGKPSLHGL